MIQVEPEDLITAGSHVIVQKLDYKKLYKVSATTSLHLGKEEIQMGAIIGKPYWTTFKVISSRNRKSNKRGPPSTLEVAEKSESLEDLKNSVTSGYDNRSINDDNKSQKLSKEDILGLRDAGKSGREIVNHLIENNASFGEKTEYSQEKYIRKKEKKYCEFLSVHKPTISSLQEIHFKQDPAKINGLRMDTLAQILSYSDVKADGTFILYDSGTMGLAAAGMLSRIGANTSGNLLYLHSGDHLPQFPILRAMNFPQEQLDRMTVSSIFDFLKNYCNRNVSVPEKGSEVKMEVEKPEMISEQKDLANSKEKLQNGNEVNSEKNKCDNINDLKRKNTEDVVEEGPVRKKSRKELDIERSVELLSESKADGLAIVAREHPLNIVQELIPFVKFSRPFVIYHAHREPLQETFVELKKRTDVTNLKLFSNFLRSYQILPDRTHPEIMTNDCGGYLLTGYTVC